VLTFQDLNGIDHSIDEFLRKVVLVDMWATWCSPCVKQIPDLNILQEKFRNDGLVILSITDEDTATVKTFLTKHEMKEEIGFIKYDDEVAEPFRHFRRGRPMYFLVDKKGIVQSGSMLKPSDLTIKKWLRQ
ncbi:MAG: TlpA family protein disulfide reductase, partial [Candidatus Marinimicrobia bacterium]|nr:TlpA family protein disulfide reductase [Candidatus Neomarinimicrobiota bacterium]